MLNGLLVIKPGLKSDGQDFDQNLQCVFSKQSGTIYSMPVFGRWTLAKLLASLLHDTHKLRLVSQPEGKCRPYVKLESVKRIVYSSHCLHHTYIYIYAMATSQALNLLLGYKKDVALADTSQNLGSLPNITTKDRPMMCLTPGSQLTILRKIRVGTNWIS